MIRSETEWKMKCASAAVVAQPSPYSGVKHKGFLGCIVGRDDEFAGVKCLQASKTPQPWPKEALRSGPRTAVSPGGGGGGGSRTSNVMNSNVAQIRKGPASPQAVRCTGV